MNIVFSASILLSGALVSCGTVPSAAPSISGPEAKALKGSFYWSRAQGPLTLGKEELSRLMSRSTIERLQYGEDGESHASALALALATLGDQDFSEVLSVQTPQVQRIVTRNIDGLWKRYGLSYPLTQGIESKVSHLSLPC